MFIILLSLFASQAGDCSARCGLSAFSKVLERVMYNRLLRFLNNHNILYYMTISIVFAGITPLLML